MEQAPLYSQCNFSWSPEWNGNPSYAINSTAYLTNINIFLCPSDTNSGKAGFINNYAASMGTTTWGYPYSDNTPSYRRSTGAFAYQAGLRSARLRRRHVEYGRLLGISGQRPHHPAEGRQVDRERRHRVRPAASTTSPSPARRPCGADVNLCSTKFQSGGGFVGSGPGITWATGAMGYTMFNTVIPPNGGGVAKWSACRMSCCAQAQHADYVVATSRHSGGVNCMFADGSVKFVKSTVSYPVWWALGTRANNETISSDSY